MEERLKNIIREIVGDEKATIDNTTNLIEDLGMDSIMLLMLVVKIEEEFDFYFPDELLIDSVLTCFEKLIKVIKNSATLQEDAKC